VRFGCGGQQSPTLLALRQEYHMHCVTPPVLFAPVGNWLCPACLSRQPGSAGASLTAALEPLGLAFGKRPREGGPDVGRLDSAHPGDPPLTSAQGGATATPGGTQPGSLPQEASWAPPEASRGRPPRPRVYRRTTKCSPPPNPTLSPRVSLGSWGDPRSSADSFPASGRTMQ